MVNILEDEFKCFVFCCANDLGQTFPLESVKVNQWNDYLEDGKIFYCGFDLIVSLRMVFRFVNPDIVYINGMFSVGYNILPLILAKWFKRRVVLSPRGMLQSGALEIRPLKKRWFLRLLRFLGTYDNIQWHATNNQESDDIERIFGKACVIRIAANIPMNPAIVPAMKVKEQGKLRMIYLSLITEKKGLHLALEAMVLIDVPVVFHIYGPVKDEPYWKKCQILIRELSHVHSIQFYGPIPPTEVHFRLSEYHVMILPTKGENFGHAIYESLSIGTPVILSKHTPWGYLQDREAGLTMDSEDKKEWTNAIRKFIDCDQLKYDQLSRGAHKLASDYFSSNDFVTQYRNLFSSHRLL